MNKSECTKHVIYLYFALNVLSWNIAFIINIYIYFSYIVFFLSMEIVGVESTDKRAVKNALTLLRLTKAKAFN